MSLAGAQLFATEQRDEQAIGRRLGEGSGRRALGKSSWRRLDSMIARV